MRRYNTTFSQTSLSDVDNPIILPVSTPISINILDDDTLESLEYFQARIVETSDVIRVRIGQQDTVKISIIDDDSETFFKATVTFSYFL